MCPSYKLLNTCLKGMGYLGWSEMSSYSDAILGFKDGADCLFVTINFIRARVVWEERISIEKIPSSDWPVANVCGRVQPSVPQAGGSGLFRK